MRFGRWTWVIVLISASGLAWGQEAPAWRTTPPQWPGQPVPEGAGRFSFAVIADFQGGQPAGSTVSADTIREINLLDPDFTICVGDLIKGDSENADEVKTQRDEIEGVLGKLRRPFYCVFGNHDSTNAKMEESLRKRYGSPWYSFNYRNCHFIVLFTESRNAAGALLNQLDPEQLAWLNRDVTANPNAEQYFIFMHKPLFQDPSWAAVEGLFEGKQLTVFAGHTHTYEQTTRKGHDYIILSTSGGQIDEKGFWEGQFYHSMLVKVTGKESSIAVIRSGAILPHDLLNAKLQSDLDRLRNQALNLAYQVPRDALELDDDCVVNLANPLSTPMIGTINWALLPDSPWKIEPMQSDFVIEPGQSTQVKFHLKYPANPFGPNPAPSPGYSLVLRSGRPEDARTPYDRGRDAVVNARGQLKLDRWPYAATVQTLRNGMKLEPVQASDKPFTVTRTVKVANLLSSPMTVGLSWKTDNTAWSIKPDSSQLLLPAHQSATADFEITCTATGMDEMPVPTLTMTAAAEGASVLTESKLLPLNLRPLLTNYCPVATVPPLSTDPKIDGVLDEPIWKEAATLGRFIDINGMGQAPVSTEVRLGRGRTGLYIGIVCQDPDMTHVIAKESKEGVRDNPIWSDDLVELFIDSTFDRLTYYHLGINALGSTYDEKNRDAGWDGRWLSAVTRGEDRWTVELFIPWSDLGGPPPPGARWGFDVGRKRPDRSPGPSYTFWSPTLKETSHVPDRFGILVFP